VDVDTLLFREYGIVNHNNDDIHVSKLYRPASQLLDQETLRILYNHAVQFGDSYLQSTVSDEKESRTFLLSTLQETYALLSIPERIECVDISHFS
jgi:excinuclease UvrABC nuclease subunit